MGTEPVALPPLNRRREEEATYDMSGIGDKIFVHVHNTELFRYISESEACLH